MNTGRDAELGNVESNEAAEKNKELPENENKKKKRKQASEDDDAILKEALAIMKKPKDDFDRFGEYVALELRTMKSEFYRGKLKQEIRAAVARITAEDENYYWSLTSPSTSSSGPPTPFALE